MISTEDNNAFNTKVRSLFGDLNNPIKTFNQDVNIFVYLKREKNTQVSISQLRLLLFANFVANLTKKKYQLLSKIFFFFFMKAFFIKG